VAGVQVRIEQTALPGIGIRYDFTTQKGRRIGVVAHRSGRRDLVIYDVEDPDSCVAQLALDDEEATALAELLGASLMVSQLAGLREEAAGLLTEKVTLTADSPYAGRPLGDAKVRSRTTASIVAVFRNGNAIISPGPDFVFTAGDVVVGVGTRDGLDAMTRIFAEG